jgi:cyclic pyranopterin phosphate synthase
MGFLDRFHRDHDDLRVSVTDRCNMRCSYCMPEAPVWFPRNQILDYEEMHRLIGVFVRHGVRKIRVTGGEPLLRKDLARFIRLLSGTSGIDDISLTTNGILLEKYARQLADAGLDRVNVSLDTLDPDRFRRLTGGNGLDRVLTGLEAASEAGLTPLKINTVLLRGFNEDEAERFVETTRQRGWEIRFIEFMPFENGGLWDPGRVVTGREVLDRIDARWPVFRDPPGTASAPAKRYRFRDGLGTVGFINSVSEPFCADCSRLRLTADGKFRVCLHDGAEIDLKVLLRKGASDRELADRIREAVRKKGRGGSLEILEREGSISGSRTMHQIGG